MSPVELLVARFDAARSSKGRAKIARRMIRLGREGIVALCERATVATGELADEIVATLAAAPSKTERVLRELVEYGTGEQSGALLALEALERRRERAANRTGSGVPRRPLPRCGLERRLLVDNEREGQGPAPLSKASGAPPWVGP